MALPTWITDQALQTASQLGLWAAFFCGLGWAFVGLAHFDKLASIAGGLSCFAALLSSVATNELSNRSNNIILSSISARTLHDADVAILNKAIPVRNVTINVQYEGDIPQKRGLHTDEEYGFKFSLENAFRAIDAAKEGRLKVEPYALPTLGFSQGTDVPGYKFDLMGTLKDPIYKALIEMGFSVLPFNHAYENFPDRIVETDTYDGSVYPAYYIVAVNKKPPPRLKGRPYWGPNIPN